MAERISKELEFHRELFFKPSKTEQKKLDMESGKKTRSKLCFVIIPRSG